ncbi:hypothetical protein TNCV_1178281 [Trichonephila clavipes]|nr:hypothetical protein TNCV_1178281 [Trichonephila clavipes]
MLRGNIRRQFLAMPTDMVYSVVPSTKGDHISDHFWILLEIAGEINITIYDQTVELAALSICTKEKRRAPALDTSHPSHHYTWGCGSPVVKVSDHGRHVMKFEPSTTKDPPCRAAMHAKSVQS